ncbi:MAG TPA: MarR family transcriptional regulator [Gemmatimonadaceae bacterium]|nr:MarR family transcriptional regulator [Gemmatimonadaceae bacterium]
MAPSELRTRPRRRRAPSPATTRASRRADIAGAVNCVRHLVRGLRLAEQQTRASTGLSAAQLFLLGQLSRADGASLTDLAERTLTDRSSVAAVVERLEDAGLVTTGRDATDRRRVLVRITGRGERTLASAPAAPTEMLLVALRRMSAADVRALCTSLGRLTAEMGLAGPAGMLFEDRPASTRSRP